MRAVRRILRRERARLSTGSDLFVGSEFLGYRIEKVLGRGGMGVVYLAEDLRLHRLVALKLLAPRLAADSRFRERLIVESELAASIDHPNIVPIYEAGESRDRMFISMRYVDGDDLGGFLRRGPLALDAVLGIVVQIADALDAAHARGLVHGDVKPSNVLIAPGAGRDGGDHVYLADFGLTHRFTESAPNTDERQLVGTIDYVAPEQIRGDAVDGRADVYSLGCLAFECLTGAAPFHDRSDVALLFAHLEEEAPSVTARRPELPRAVDAVCARALAKEPAERPATCRAFVDDLRRALRVDVRTRPRWPVWFAAAVAACSVLAGVLYLRNGSGPTAAAGGDHVVRIDPRTNRVSERFGVGRPASEIATGAGAVWVTDLRDGTISRIDIRTKRIRTVPVAGEPTSVGGAAVVADGFAHKLTVFDAANAALSYPVAIRGTNVGEIRVAGGDGSVWFGDPAAGIVGRVDDALTAGTARQQITISPDRSSFVSSYQAFDGLAVGAGSIWVLGDPFERKLWRIDARTRAVRVARLSFVPGAVAVGHGAIWVTSLLDDTVSRVSPKSMRTVATIPVGRGVTGIAAGAGGVWVANRFSDTISRIDPKTNRVTTTIAVKGAPVSVAADGDGVWVATTSEPRPPGANTIGIGVLSDCRGTFGALRNDSLAAAELPLIERGGRREGALISDGVGHISIGGRPIRLVFGCADGTAASALGEARRLVERMGVRILVGPTTGDEEIALQEYARRHPEITFVNGSAAVQELHPAPNFFSFWFDGAQWMAGLGSYAYHTLGWRTAVTIGTAEAFDWAQTAGFDAEFCSLGGSIVKRIWLPQGAQDFSAPLAQVAGTHADGFLVETQGTGALSALATGYPGLRGSLARKVVMGSTTVGPPQLGARMRGVVFAGARTPPAWYLAKLRTSFPEIRNDFLGSAFDYAYYDAMAATLQALERVRGDLSHGETAFAAALAKVVLSAPNGRTRLDAAHQAIAPTTLAEALGAGYSARALGVSTGVDDTFGGYFTRNDPPPSPTAPACKHRSPPAWAR